MSVRYSQVCVVLVMVKFPVFSATYTKAYMLHNIHVNSSNIQSLFDVCMVSNSVAMGYFYWYNFIFVVVVVTLVFGMSVN